MAQAQAQHSTPQGALDTALGPFATLSIWREKLQADLSEPGADQLRLLLRQQGYHLAEQVVLPGQQLVLSGYPAIRSGLGWGRGCWAGGVGGGDSRDHLDA